MQHLPPCALRCYDVTFPYHGIDGPYLLFVLLVVPCDGQVEGDVGVRDYADAGSNGPEIEVEDPWEVVLLGHCSHDDLDVAVFWERGERLTHEFEMAPKEGVGRFGLVMSALSLCD